MEKINILFKMSKLQILLLFLIIISIKSEIYYSSCINGTRTLTFENGIKYKFPCISCITGNYTKYDEETKDLECELCPSGSTNYGSDILISNFTEKYLSRFSYYLSQQCPLDKECPFWKLSTMSIKTEYESSLTYTTSFNFNQYYMQDGQLTIKYINLNGGVDKIFNIYINNKLIFKDDSENSIVKTKTFSITKGNNYFTFEYSINEKLKTKSLNKKHSSYIEIFEILMSNSETSAIDCEKFENLTSLKNNLHNGCDYDISKCSFSKDICTYRFYLENKNDYCDIKTNTRHIEYEKLGDANCQELITPIGKDEPCPHCSYGQFLLEDENTNKKTCKYCEENNYSSKEINDNSACEGICENHMEKIFNIEYFYDSSKYENENINIIEGIGSLIIYYVRFNEKYDTNIFFELDNNNSSFKLLNPNDKNNSNDYYIINLPLSKGNHSIKIKGNNLDIKKISIKGSDMGGNYNCVDELNTDSDIICEKNDEYYSKIQKKCITCPLGTNIDQNKDCTFINKFVNDKFTLDNQLLDLNIFSNSYNIDISQKKFYLNINPTFPFIYYEDLETNNIEIIAKELNNIKLIKGNNERGMILSFIYIENNKTSYSHIYLKCSTKNDTEDFIKYINTIISGEDTHYFFEAYTNDTCPYCLTSEVEYNENDFECINKTRTVDLQIKNGALCVIKNYDDTDKSKITNNNELLLKKNSENVIDKLLIENFNITENIPINYELKNDDVITSNQKTIKCGGEIIVGTGLTILIVVASVLGLCLIGVIIWKIVSSVKSKNNVIKVDDEPRIESLVELGADNKPLTGEKNENENIDPQSIMSYNKPK